jgi:acetyltransferase
VALAPVGRTSRGPPGCPRFAIKPCPKEWERHTTLRDGTTILIRPLRPEDESLYAPFFAAVTKNDVRLRFFAPVKEFDHAFLARLTHIDYGRAMAFIALDDSSGRMLGVVRLHANANNDTAEYAILVRSDLKGRGLGWLLMQMIIDYARAEGVQAIEGQVLRENTTMLAMCKELGFDIIADPNDVVICIAKLTMLKKIGCTDDSMGH